MRDFIQAISKDPVSVPRLAVEKNDKTALPAISDAKEGEEEKDNEQKKEGDECEVEKTEGQEQKLAEEDGFAPVEVDDSPNDASVHQDDAGKENDMDVPAMPEGTHQEQQPVSAAAADSETLAEAEVVTKAEVAGDEGKPSAALETLEETQVVPPAGETQKESVQPPVQSMSEPLLPKKKQTKGIAEMFMNQAAAMSLEIQAKADELNSSQLGLEPAVPMPSDVWGEESDGEDEKESKKKDKKDKKHKDKEKDKKEKKEKKEKKKDKKSKHEDPSEENGPCIAKPNQKNLLKDGEELSTSTSSVKKRALPGEDGVDEPLTPKSAQPKTLAKAKAKAKAKSASAKAAPKTAAQKAKAKAKTFAMAKNASRRRGAKKGEE